MKKSPSYYGNVTLKHGQQNINRRLSHLNLNSELSTVQEDRSPLPLTAGDDNNAKRQLLFSKYIEKENERGDDDDDCDFDDLSEKVKFANSVHSNPSLSHGKEKFVTSGSLSSISSRAPSIRSAYSESDDTDQSDYADDFDGLERNNVDLLASFKRRNELARKMAQQGKSINQKRYDSIRQKLGDIDYFDKDNTIAEDFEDFDNIDPHKLYRFKVIPSGHSIGRKKSMPLIKNRSSFNSPHKSVKRFASTLELVPGRSVNRKQSITGYELEDFDDLTSDDITITYADYQKLKRKSQKFDFSKYVEEPIKKNHRKYKFNNSQHNDNLNTTRLTKEGKLKVITAMGRPKIRKVMPGHLYGEVIYDPDQMKWFGNNEDLSRFESVSESKPQLIQPSQSNGKPQIFGNMIYDESKLRWVSLSGKYEDDPFDEEDQEIENNKEYQNKNKLYKLQTQQTRFPTVRVKSRLVPSGSTMSLSAQLNNNNHFTVTPQMYKSWKNEEARWMRKVGNWFPHDVDNYHSRYELKLFLNRQ